MLNKIKSTHKISPRPRGHTL